MHSDLTSPGLWTESPWNCIKNNSHFWVNNWQVISNMEIGKIGKLNTSCDNNATATIFTSWVCVCVCVCVIMAKWSWLERSHYKMVSSLFLLPFLAIIVMFKDKAACLSVFYILCCYASIFDKQNLPAWKLCNVLLWTGAAAKCILATSSWNDHR